MLQILSRIFLLHLCFPAFHAALLHLLVHTCLSACTPLLLFFTSPHSLTRPIAFHPCPVPLAPSLLPPDVCGYGPREVHQADLEASGCDPAQEGEPGGCRGSAPIPAMSHASRVPQRHVPYSMFHVPFPAMPCNECRMLIDCSRSTPAPRCSEIQSQSHRLCILVGACGCEHPGGSVAQAHPLHGGPNPGVPGVWPPCDRSIGFVAFARLLFLYCPCSNTPVWCTRTIAARPTLPRQCSCKCSPRWHVPTRTRSLPTTTCWAPNWASSWKVS